MTCERVVESLALYVYGELDPFLEEEVEAHLHLCAACRLELERQERLHYAMDRARVVPGLDDIAACRSELMRAIEQGEVRRPSGWRARLRGAGNFLREATLPRAILRPAGALALVALGFFGARWTNEPHSPASGGPAAEPVVAAVRSVQPDASGGVQIAYDEIRRRHVQGRLTDNRIERLLLAAARDEANVGLRVESIGLLKDYTESADVRSALVQAARADPNPGVRLKALEGLKGMSANPEVRRMLVNALQDDDNPGVRILAIDMLVQQRDDDLVGVLQRVVTRENNNYVRMRCKTALEEMNASVGTF